MSSRNRTILKRLSVCMSIWLGWVLFMQTKVSLHQPPSRMNLNEIIVHDGIGSNSSAISDVNRTQRVTVADRNYSTKDTWAPRATSTENPERRLGQTASDVVTGMSSNSSAISGVNRTQGVTVANRNYGTKGNLAPRVASTTNPERLLGKTASEKSATDMFFGNTHIEKTFKYLKVLGANDSVSRRERVRLTIGIPTIRRHDGFYLIKTLSALLKLRESEKEQCLIIVFVAEPQNYTFVEEIYETIKKTFPSDLKSGLIEVIYPSSALYPNLDHLKQSFNDSAQRIKWRTKENLDAAHLMTYAKDRGRYFLFLEDDILAKPGYFNNIMNQIKQQTQNGNQWMTINVVRRNSKGLLFKSEHLWIFSEYIFMFHDDQPIDYLYDELFRMKTCQKYLTKQDVEKCVGIYKRMGKVGLFQHIGKHSSLDGLLRKDLF